MNVLHATPLPDSIGTPIHIGTPPQLPSSATRPLADADQDHSATQVRQAVDLGEHRVARLGLLKLSDQAQAELVQQLPPSEVVRLTQGLNNYSVANLCERLPNAMVQMILRALPKFKRHGVEIILAHRRQFCATTPTTS